MLAKTIETITGLLRGRDVAAGEAFSLMFLGGLCALPLVLYVSGRVLGPAAEILAFAVLVPCGILGGRVASARDRQRRLRAWWD
jgi:hypothetical protein